MNEALHDSLQTRGANVFPINSQISQNVSIVCFRFPYQVTHVKFRSQYVGSIWKRKGATKRNAKPSKICLFSLKRLSSIMPQLHPIVTLTALPRVSCREGIPPATGIMIKISHRSGQIIIFHQPRFPWNKGISLPQLPFGGPGRVTSLQFD